MRAGLAVFLTLYLLLALVAQADSAISGLHVWLYAGGLYVVYPALLLPLRQGLAATILAGLLCDATSPLAFGTHALHRPDRAAIGNEVTGQCNEIGEIRECPRDDQIKFFRYFDARTQRFDPAGHYRNVREP